MWKDVVSAIMNGCTVLTLCVAVVIVLWFGHFALATAPLLILLVTALLVLNGHRGGETFRNILDGIANVIASLRSQKPHHREQAMPKSAQPAPLPHGQPANDPHKTARTKLAPVAPEITAKPAE